jgi:hypothetical protein
MPREFSASETIIHSPVLLMHRIGYSAKGWTDGEIGLFWIKDFDKRTKDKAKWATKTSACRQT